MKKNLFIAIAIVLIFGQSSISQDTWTFLGPEGTENLTCLHIDKQNDVLLAGTIEGFRYYDLDTEVWTSQTEPGSIGREVWSITTYPEASGRIITGRVNAWFKGYLEISNDWGLTNSVTFDSDGGKIKDVKFCPSQAEIMFACGWSDVTPGDLLKSTDGGQSWEQLSNYLHTAMTEIALHPYSTDTLYVSGNALVTKSVDGGNTWTAAANGLPSGLGVYCVDIDPFQPQTLLCSNDNGIYKTTDGGDNWQAVFNRDCKHFAFNPVYEGVVAAITFSPYKILLSYDKGDNWVDYTDQFPGDNLMDIQFHEDGLLLYVESLSGVYSREVDVTGIENNKPETEKFSFYPNPAKTSLYFEGTSEIKQIRIYNQTGQLFLQSKSDTKPLDISLLPKGVYILEATLKSGKQTEKLVVE